MKVSATKTSPRVERNIYITSKKIKGYGTHNDYPQKVLEIINSSGTGRTCMDIYVKFVEGAGFTDKILAETIFNSDGERGNSLLRKCAKDLKNFNGFAVLIKYDGTALPFEYYSIPFEQCRIEITSGYKYTGRIAVHSDWTGLTGVVFRQNDVKFLNRYAPEKVIAEMTEAGGPTNYPGQIIYFTADGDFEYPISPFDPVITDMLTEDSVSTVKNRNAKNNFLPAGLLVRKGIKPRVLDDGTVDTGDAYNREKAESAENIKKLQGDEKACMIWVVDVDSDEEIPVWISWEAKNYDRQYELTEKTVQDNIGKMSIIPPILRGVDVGAGFGADLMNNAYDFMNNVTDNERRMLSTAFMDLLKYYKIQFVDYTIESLQYSSNSQTITKPIG